MKTCPECGRAIHITRLGDLETMACARCTWYLGTTVYSAENIPTSDISVQWSITFLWKHERPTSKEALLSKRLIPAWDNLSVPMLLAMFGDEPSFEVGHFSRQIALEMEEKASLLGLDIILRRSDNQ